MKASNNGRFFLAAEFKHKLAAFDAVTGRKLGEYDTKFESGGSRMCISGDGRYFAAAAYGRFGITLYETETGKALWKTIAVKRIQRLYFSNDDKLIYAVNAECVRYTLSAEDGSIIAKDKGYEKFVPDDEIDVSIVREYLCSGCRSKKFPMPLLDLCIGEGRVFCSVMRGGLVCCTPDPEELWSAENIEGEHYVRLAYVKKYGYVAAQCYKFMDGRTEPFCYVDVFSAKTGEKIYSFGLGKDYVFAFVNGGEQLVSGSGIVYDLGEKGSAVSGMTYDIADNEEVQEE